MGKWLRALIAYNENPPTPLLRTDKTDKTPVWEVLSVLSVPQERVLEIFPAGAAVSEAQPEPVPEPTPEPSGDTKIPALYANAYAAFLASPPTGVASEMWERAKDDAEAFLERWGRQAVRLGWTATDLFEHLPGRDNGHGLIWTLAKEQAWVVALTDEMATLERDEFVWRTFVPRLSAFKP